MSSSKVYDLPMLTPHLCLQVPSLELEFLVEVVDLQPVLLEVSGWKAMDQKLMMSLDKLDVLRTQMFYKDPHQRGSLCRQCWARRWEVGWQHEASQFWGWHGRAHNNMQACVGLFLG